jgi:hypothetical protein
MSQENKVSCSRPTGGVVGEPEQAPETGTSETKQIKGGGSMIRVGQKAPDFMAPAYHNGSFTSVRLSEFLGKWVALCFYPGDFTFV